MSFPKYLKTYHPGLIQVFRQLEWMRDLPSGGYDRHLSKACVYCAAVRDLRNVYRTWRFKMGLIERAKSFEGMALAMRYEEFKRYGEAISRNDGQDSPELFFAYLSFSLSCDN